MLEKNYKQPALSRAVTRSPWILAWMKQPWNGAKQTTFMNLSPPCWLIGTTIHHVQSLCYHQHDFSLYKENMCLLVHRVNKIAWYLDLLDSVFFFPKKHDLKYYLQNFWHTDPFYLRRSHISLLVGMSRNTCLLRSHHRVTLHIKFRNKVTIVHLWNHPLHLSAPSLCL